MSNSNPSRRVRRADLFNTCRSAQRTLLIVAAFVVVGCSKSPYVPVSGKVTLDGAPLAGVDVRFQPVGGTLSNPNVGKGSAAATDEEGKFTLRVDKETVGAMPGKHRVSIAHPWGKKPRRPNIPSRYNAESTLTYEVPAEGTDAANFDLKSR